MKHMKTVEVPAKTKEVVEKTTCDLCGEEIKIGNTSAEEVEIRHRRGYTCRDGGSGTESIFDLCGQCFDDKLLPWFWTQGAKPKTDSWEW